MFRSEMQHQVGHVAADERACRIGYLGRQASAIKALSVALIGSALK